MKRKALKRKLLAAMVNCGVSSMRLTCKQCKKGAIGIGFIKIVTSCSYAECVHKQKPLSWADVIIHGQELSSKPEANDSISETPEEAEEYELTPFYEFVWRDKVIK